MVSTVAAPMSGRYPGVVVLGAGLTLTVAPLTAAVMAAVDSHHLGVGSAINNAMARIGGLLAVAVMPGLAGLSGAAALTTAEFTDGYQQAMWISAVLCAVGGVTAWLTIRTTQPVTPVTHADIGHSCHDQVLCGALVPPCP